MNWGGITIDERTGTLFVNDMRMPLRMSLVRKEDMAKYNVSTDEVPGFMGTVRYANCRAIRRRADRYFAVGAGRSL
ncbi:hypothetical protein QYS46_19610 [Klebsiella michiganensis]|nr:hypothetical protein [Klebsiella michiganensis]